MFPNGITPAIMNYCTQSVMKGAAVPDLEKLYVIECKKYNYFISHKPGFELHQNQNVKVYNDPSAFEKTRTILNENVFKVNDKKGNIYELINTNTNNKVHKPRYKIKSFNFN